jgi:mono/diheme cytochrome c family protein
LFKQGLSTMRSHPALSIPLLVFALGFASSAYAVEDPQVAYGKRLVEKNCARCHAVGPGGESAHPDAPPFRLLHRRYPIEDLQEALAEGISTGHPDMPEFVASPDQISAIISYIQSLGR